MIYVHDIQEWLSLIKRGTGINSYEGVVKLNTILL